MQSEYAAILLSPLLKGEERQELDRENRVERTDIVIVGSGAGASPLALDLSVAGFDVLVLEKGPCYSRNQYQPDELLGGRELSLFTPLLVDEPHIVVYGDGVSERTSFGWIACCVGGGTSHMGACLYRFHPIDFEMQSRFGMHGCIADWPYRYQDLEQYYRRAEEEVGVSGLAGVNPFEGYRSSPFPMPPLITHALAPLLDTACKQLELHPFPTPRAINSQPYGGRPACVYKCTFCSGFGCPIGARGSTQETVLSKAEKTGRCHVRANSMVREITVRQSGHADGCIYIDERGAEHRVVAGIVCVCCSAVESARLLLLSRSRLFPDGLANDSGLVGRNLQFHGFSAGKASFDRHLYSGSESGAYSFFLGRSLMDYYLLPSEVSEFPKGGILRFDVVRPAPIGAAQLLAAEGGGTFLWGERLKHRLKEYFRETVQVEFEVFHDFIPTEQCFVELDSRITDRWGLPVARIHISESDHQKMVGQWLVDRGLDILRAMGGAEVHATAVGSTAQYLIHGTCRAGRDHRNSVLNEFCQAYDVPNLFVVDGSFMPTSGGAPSTLTILANSFRTADYIIQGARTGGIC